MTPWIVFYRDDSLGPIDPPYIFKCTHADTYEHAEEQCTNAEPNAEIVWVYEGGNIQDAWKDYWAIVTRSTNQQHTNRGTQ